MKIALQFDYEVGANDINVDISLRGTSTLYQTVLDLRSGVKHLLIERELDSFVPQELVLSFETDNIKITKNPVTIVDLLLDDFYSMDKVLYSGHVHPSEQYKLYTKVKKIYLEDNIVDSNRLDFAGCLQYHLCWPFYRNIYTDLGA